MTTRYALPGTRQLDLKMRAVRENDRVRVTYEGEKFATADVVGWSKSEKQFRVEVDRAA